jgi:hypothetical protein
VRADLWKLVGKRRMNQLIANFVTRLINEGLLEPDCVVHVLGGCPAECCEDLEAASSQSVVVQTATPLLTPLPSLATSACPSSPTLTRPSPLPSPAASPTNLPAEPSASISPSPNLLARVKVVKSAHPFYLMKYAKWHCQAEYMDRLVENNDAGERVWACCGRAEHNVACGVRTRV